MCDLDTYLVPFAAGAISAGLIGDRVESAQVGRNFPVKLRHIFQSVDFVKSPTGALREGLETRSSGGVDASDSGSR